MTTPLDRPAPYVVIDDVLPPDQLAALVEWCLTQETVLVPSGVGPPRSGKIDPTVRSSRIMPGPVFKPWRAPLRERFGALLPSIQAGLRTDPFEVGKFEIGLAVHNDGDFYRRHIDSGRADDPQKARTISMVYYFNAEPRGYSGGALRLHPFRGDANVVDIEPRNNRLVAFPSWAQHEVMPVMCPSGRFEDSRFAINCWVHRAIAPAPSPEAATTAQS